MKKKITLRTLRPKDKWKHRSPWTRGGDQRGFNVIELSLVMIITLITLTGALPALQGYLRSYRSSGDAASISGQLALARMRSAANFTHARLNFNLASNSYQLEIYDKTTNQFQLEGGAQRLAENDSYGYGHLSTPAGTQTTIGQSSSCLDGAGQSIAGTACILFNSRGIPVDGTGASTSNDAIYLTDGSGGYLSVTVSPSGRISVWRYMGSTWTER